MTALGTVGWGLKLKPAEAAELGIHEQLDELSETIVALQNEDPKPIGFEYALPLVINAFDKRTPEEVDLLAGRLYYEAYQRLSSTPKESVSGRDFSKENIRSILSTELPITGFSRAHFNSLLADTQAKVAADAEFRKAIEESAQRAKNERHRCMCTEHLPCWACVILIVVIIVVFA
jgi:hypothetical protein